MGYVFDAMTKAGPVRKPALRRPAKKMPEIQTIAIVPGIVPETGNDQAAQTYQPLPIDAAPTPFSIPPSAVSPVPPSAPLSVVSPHPLLTETISGVDARLIAITHPTSPIAEEYRAIRTHLLVRYDQRRHFIHCLASSIPGEGVTITALNLGFAFSELSDRTTLIVEANLRSPSFGRLLGLGADGPGVVQVLRGESSLDEATRTIGRTNLSVITAGAVDCHDAIQLLASQAFSDLMHGLRHRYDHVIVDTAPALELADAGLVGALADDMMLIVRSGATPRSLIEQTIARLKSYNVPLGGVLLTGAAPSPARYRYEGK